MIQATQKGGLRLDVLGPMEEFWDGPKYRALNNNLGSKWFVDKSKSGEEFSDEEMDFIHDQILVYKGLRSNVAEVDDYDEWSQWFETVLWPNMREKIADNHAGLGWFYLWMAKNSNAVPMFDDDAWGGNLATACLLAFGITHDIHGKLKPIDMDDPMLIYIKENSSLAFMRYRSSVARKEIIRLRDSNSDRKIRVGIFGGGAEPALWSGGLIDGVEFIVYDINPKMKGALEQIVEQPLEKLGIDYRTDNFINAFADTSLHDTFDLIVYNGVMSYYPEKKVMIAAGTRQLLKKGGIMLFDDILMHPDMEFGLLVRCWTVKLVPELSLEAAVEKNKEALPAAGLKYDHYEYQDVRGIHNCVVNWAIKE